MLVSFQTAMPVLVALLAILTTWLLIERSERTQATPVFATDFTIAEYSQPGQIFQSVPVGQMHLREARRGSPDIAPTDVRPGGMPVRAWRLL